MGHNTASLVATSFNNCDLTDRNKVRIFLQKLSLLSEGYSSLKINTHLSFSGKITLMYLHKHRQIYIVPTETNFRNRETEIWDKVTTWINKLIQQMVLDKEYSWTFFINIFSDLNILNICINLQLRISMWLKGFVL